MGLSARHSPGPAAERSRRHPDRSKHLAPGRSFRKLLRHSSLRGTAPSPRSRPSHRRGRNSRLRLLVGRGAAAHSAFLPRGPHHRRRRAGYRGDSKGRRTGHPRASRPMAVDSPALEDAPSRRAGAVLRGSHIRYEFRKFRRVHRRLFSSFRKSKIQAILI